jgi:coproporphyrinogen III oxidase
MANPHVPAVHMNTRFLVTTKRWFGGGADLNPPIPYEEDTADFHARLRAACAAHDQTFYPTAFRNGRRTISSSPTAACTAASAASSTTISGDRRPVRGELRLHPRRRRGVPRHLPQARAAADGHAVHRADKARQLEWRGRYAEFNLIYDRGTLFGLKTGGNVDAILMSLPPLATWPVTSAPGMKPGNGGGGKKRASITPGRNRNAPAIAAIRPALAASIRMASAHTAL